MAIINRKTATTASAATAATTATAAPTAAAPVEQAAEKPASSSTSAFLIGGLALVIGVAAPIGGYLYLRQPGQPAIDVAPTVATPTVAAAAPAADVPFEIERLIKVSSIASLSKKEFELNVVSLTEAERAGSAAVTGALEIVVDKKRQELAEAKARMVELLAGLHPHYAQRPQDITRHFESAIVSAQGADQTETVRLLRLSLKALAGVPTGANLPEYLHKALDETL